MKDRTLESYSLWRLVVGLLVFAIMTLILGQLADEVTMGRPLTLLDANLSHWLHIHRTPFLTLAMKTTTLLGSTLAGILAVIFIGLYLLSRRQHYWFTAITLSILGGMILNRLLKLAFQRTRPHFDDPILSFTGYSFPSGHTITATVVFGALAAFLFSRTRKWSTRLAVMLFATTVIGLVGFSRIYLGAHYLSDVLAAIAEGLAWLSLCFTVVYSLWRPRNPLNKPKSQKQKAG